jgi:hypothetical protein
VIAGFGDDGATVRMADEDRRAVVGVERLLCRGDVSFKADRGVLR